MKEYIEREALIDEINIAPVSMSICMNVDECKGRIYERERLLRIINQATAADVVPVVRCGECRIWDKHWIPNYSRDNEHFCPFLGIVTHADWFCADGEKRAENG